MSATVLRLITILCITGCAAHAQLQAQFDRLMGQPKEVEGHLINFPWKADLPETLPGFRRVPPGQTIRIAAVERPVRSHSRWTHWESEDGNAWMDLIQFTEPWGAAETLRSARQPHSGFFDENQILLFSNTGDRLREALGAGMIAGRGMLLNVGVKLPLEVHWDRPLPDADRIAFDAALTRFQAMLEMLARAFLDPAYVSFEPRIAPRSEALPVLRMAAFARLWSYIKYNFVYLDKRPELNWDSILDEYMPRIAAAKDDAEYGRILQRVVALLKDGHTNVYPNSVAPADAPAIMLEPIQGKAVATLVGNLPELAAIRPGMELTAIDGTPVATIIERDLDPYISTSTPQDRDLRRMRMLMQGPPGSAMRTKWLSPEGKEVELTLTRNGSKNRDALTYPSHPRYERRQLPGNIAYVALSDFGNAATATDFERDFDRIRNAKAWIIDLRYNGGGSSETGYRVLAHFIDTPAEGSTSSSRQYIPTFEALGRAQGWHEFGSDKIEPAAGPHYQGPVYVLTSPSTCSAAEDFLIPLRILKRVTIVGEPTCGSTGQPLPFTIYGASARVCTKWDRFPDGTEFVGVGVVPDVKAARSKQDVVSGRDAVLETAIALASK